MMPSQHYDVIMLTSPIVPDDIIIDFDPIDFFPVWEFDQNAITFAYSVCLRKKLYVWNQRDEMDTMALVFSDSEKFYF
jgi:hypothetical protein